MNSDAPKILARLPQWVLWRYVGKDKRKVPFQISGDYASTTDPATWSDYQHALGQSFGYDGLGFCFASKGGLFGVDLDNCVDELGEIQPWAMAIVKAFGTYAEISPSGGGVKLWGLGKSPLATGKKRAIDQPQVRDKPPAVECYDHGRFFCFTGEKLPGVPDEPIECQAALDRFVAEFWPPEQKPKIKPGNGQYVGTLERARLYLSKIEPAVSGQGGHNRTFRAACVLMIGFGMNSEQGYNLLAEWNQTCEPPWSEKELRHKIKSAEKQPGERGFLLVDNRWETVSDVDLSQFMRAEEGESHSPTNIPASAALFPQDCLRPPGLLAEIIDWNLRTALWPQPELALAAALALLGAVTGRKVQDYNRTRTNVYCLGLAASGSGKEHARTITKEILLRAGADKMLGPEGLASSAGLIQFVNSQPAILLQLDEIGRLLETMRDPRKAPHLFKIGSELMKLDSCSNTLYKGDAYANQKQSVVINQPHCCIYGTCVPRGFWESLTHENVSEGLLGRMFVFESSRRYVQLAEPVTGDPPEEIMAGVRWWLERSHGPGDVSDSHPKPSTIGYSPEAKARMADHMRGICEQRLDEDDTRAALWSRTTGKTAKLALLFACSRATCEVGDFAIELGDVNLAIKISNWLTRRMLWQAYRHVSHNEREGAVKRVLRLLETKLSKSDLTRRTQWLDRRKREEIMGELIDSGLVKTWREETGGKVPTTWFEIQD